MLVDIGRTDVLRRLSKRNSQLRRPGRRYGAPHDRPADIVAACLATGVVPVAGESVCTRGAYRGRATVDSTGQTTHTTTSGMMDCGDCPDGQGRRRTLQMATIIAAPTPPAPAPARTRLPWAPSDCSSRVRRHQRARSVTWRLPPSIHRCSISCDHRTESASRRVFSRAPDGASDTQFSRTEIYHEIAEQLARRARGGSRPFASSPRFLPPPT